MISVVKWWSTSCLIVVNTAKIFLSIENCCLFHFADVYRLQKKFNHLVYDVDHIVENIFLVNGWLTSCLLFVNCLYESWQVEWYCLQSIILANIVKMFYKDITLLRMLKLIIYFDGVVKRSVNKLFECCKHAPESF